MLPALASLVTAATLRAVDPVGNEALAAPSAVGWFDYRTLPWIPMAAMLLAAVAAVYFLRVPRREPAAWHADDDAALEEIEPD